MSTRSGIRYVCPDGKVKAVYCHYDGYPDGVGALLSNFYNNQKAAEDIISLGDLSYLSMRLNPIGEHSFDNPEDNTTVAYHRDRGEEFNNEVFENIEDFFDNAPDCYDAEYLYLFNDNKWHCYDVYDTNKEIKLLA